MMISGSSGNVTLKINKRDMCSYEKINLDYNICKRYEGKGEPSPQREALVNAFLSGIAPGV